VKDGSLNVYDLCSPSKVISARFLSPMEIYLVTSFPGNDARRSWS
jgi:hypothetical protein